MHSAFFFLLAIFLLLEYDRSGGLVRFACVGLAVKFRYHYSVYMT